jgi:hypothetical protein
MMGPHRLLRTLGVLCLLPLLAAAADEPCRLCTRAEGSSQVEAKREIPLSLEISTKLNFSRAALTGSSGGAIEIDPHSGDRRTDGGIVDLGGSAFAGSAVLRGEPGRSVRIDMPATARMTSSTGGQVEISGIRTTLSPNPRLDSTGRLEFSFGGRLVVRGPASGTFRARIPITAQYE